METSLHRELKILYAGAGRRPKFAAEGYRIDAVTDDRLIEIQHGSLSAIRDKIRRLVESHRVLVVKPIVAAQAAGQMRVGGRPRRIAPWSPKRGKLLDMFDELVYFTRVFPHPRLELEIVLVEVEEWRHPGHGRRRRWRTSDHVVSDRRLVAVGESVRLARAADLVRLMPPGLPKRFHTGHLAELTGVNRTVAQRIAYCLREMKAIETVGKEGNAIVYQLPARGRRKAGAA